MRTQTLLSLALLSLLPVGTPGCDREPPPIVAETAAAQAESLAVHLPYDGVGTATFSRTSTLTGGSPVDARPYKFKVPTGYDPAKATPLVVLLHGLTASGELEALYINLTSLADKRTFLYAYPDGTKDPVGARFWNATDFCCDFFHSEVDDVAYLNAVIDDMAKHYNVDSKRIFLVGHSNGGYMAHRMACDSSTRIAGIVSLAGAQWKDPLHCLPTDRVAVLQVHGTLDTLVAYNGGPLYPSAHDTVATWANRNSCLGALTYSGQNLDLDSVLLGAETKVEKYTGCPEPGAVELWTIQGGSHVPLFTSYWPTSIYDFLMAHPKP